MRRVKPSPPTIFNATSAAHDCYHMRGVSVIEEALFGSRPTSGLAAEALAKATERSMHSMGGMGFAREMHVERLWRDSRLSQFAPVPQEMILNFIAQHDLGMPRSY